MIEKLKKIQWLIWLALLFAGDFAMTVLVSQRVGSIATFGAYACFSAIGLFLLWQRWPQAKASCNIITNMRRHKQTRHPSPGEQQEQVEAMRNAAFYGFSLFLFLVPGFLTAAAGFCLLLPRVRDAIMPSAASKYRVTNFRIKGPYTLRIEFDDNTRQTINFESLWEQSAYYEELSDREYFKQVVIDEEYGTLVWPDGFHFPADLLHDWSKLPEGFS